MKQIICILFLVVISCSKPDRLGLHLKYLNSQNPAIDVENWQTSQIENDDETEFYRLRKSFEDGHARLEIRYNKVNDTYFLVDFYKEFKDEDRFAIASDQMDTLYLVKLSGEYDSLVFIVGEYQYLFSKMMLDHSQRQYFLDHSDSLRKVRGDNLPKLPQN